MLYSPAAIPFVDDFADERLRSDAVRIPKAVLEKART